MPVVRSVVAAAVCAGDPDRANSDGDHSLHAWPAARIPRGVSSMRRATASHNRRGEFVAVQEAAGTSSPLTRIPEVLCSRVGSATCKYATSPAEIAASANPANVRWPIIIAVSATLNGYGAYSGVPAAS